MVKDNKDKLSSWAYFLDALGNFSSKMVWTIIGIIVLAAIGRYLFFSARQSEEPPQQKQTAESIPIKDPIPWHEVDKEIVVALKAAHQTTDEFAQNKLGQWTKELEKRVDKNFLKWYFSYWQQQWLGLKSMGYWIEEKAAGLPVIEKLFDEQPTMAQEITEDIQEEFAKRVLRPEIAQIQMERIAQQTIEVYVNELRKHLSAIPKKYDISKMDWDKHLSDIAVMTSRSEGDRQVALTLKTLFASGAGGGAVVAAKLTKMLKEMIAKVGTKMTTKAAAKGAGKAAAKVASKTGGKLGAKVAGKFLGAIVGIGVIVWDVWDHHHTEKIERPILRQNIVDYLSELEHSLLYEPDAGLMTIIDNLEANIVSSLPST